MLTINFVSANPPESLIHDRTRANIHNYRIIIHKRLINTACLILEIAVS